MGIAGSNPAPSSTGLLLHVSMMKTLRIASRVAAYMYSDGIPYDGAEMHKDLAAVYASHVTKRHKIDMSKLQSYKETPEDNS